MARGAFHKIDKSRQNHPSRKKYVPLFDYMAYVIGIAGAFFDLPQLLKIWHSHDASGVSLISWEGFAVTSIFWLVFSLYRKEKALAWTFGASLVFQIAIVAGIIAAAHHSIPIQ